MFACSEHLQGEAVGRCPNITMSLDQHRSVVVDQDNHVIMTRAEQHLDAGHLDFFRWVLNCWNQLFKSSVSEHMRHTISVLAFRL